MSCIPLCLQHGMIFRHSLDVLETQIARRDQSDKVMAVAVEVLFEINLGNIVLCIAKCLLHSSTKSARFDSKSPAAR